MVAVAFKQYQHLTTKNYHSGNSSRLNKDLGSTDKRLRFYHMYFIEVAIKCFKTGLCVACMGLAKHWYLSFMLMFKNNL